MIAVALGVEGDGFVLQVIGQAALTPFDQLWCQGATVICSGVELKAPGDCFDSLGGVVVLAVGLFVTAAGATATGVGMAFGAAYAAAGIVDAEALGRAHSQTLLNVALGGNMDYLFFIIFNVFLIIFVYTTIIKNRRYYLSFGVFVLSLIINYLYFFFSTSSGYLEASYKSVGFSLIVIAVSAAHEWAVAKFSR